MRSGFLAQRYGHEILPGPPADAGLRRFGYGTDDSSTVGGLTVRFCGSSCEAWLGLFAGSGLGGVSGVFPTSEDPLALVLAGGAGYIVDAVTGGLVEALPVLPIREVVAVHAKGLLVVANDTVLVAYRGAERVWTTARVALDGISIVSACGDTIMINAIPYPPSADMEMRSILISTVTGSVLE